MNPLEALLALASPNECEACGRALVEGERILCLHCLADFPYTGFEQSAGDNELCVRLASRRCRIDRATSLFYYMRKTPYARLVQMGKYGHRPQVIERLMGKYVSDRLVPAGFFDGIDLIVPVPLHWLRLVRRGYNQSARLAHEVGRLTGISVADALKARRHTSQTLLSGHERQRSVEHVYSAIPGATAEASHALLIDDIITTGATVTQCASALLADNPTLRVSVLSLCTTMA